ncbi:MAG: permease [Candidatus Moranbacteria bacterium]|nr:permease [Candidatus Moranbacteria bacterium]
MKLTGFKNKAIRGFIWASLIFFVVDFIYKVSSNISFVNREKCILYRVIPKFWFLIFEYFVELTAVMVVGIFIATLLEFYFLKFKKFYPKSPLTAFFYASLLPVCGCGAIPLLKSLKGKIKYGTLVTLVVAAPLLSPYVIILSFSVLGTKYAVLRIISSFILAITSGIVMEYFYKDEKEEIAVPKDAGAASCNRSCAAPQGKDVFLETFAVFKKLLPYLLFAALLGLALEYTNPKNILLNLHIGNNFWGIALFDLIGIPLYFCNGAEVLILKPLIHFGGLGLGSAIAFSLTSTAICITSIVLLIKFIGKRMTFILTVQIFIVTLILGYLINTFG